MIWKIIVAILALDFLKRCIQYGPYEVRWLFNRITPVRFTCPICGKSVRNLFDHCNQEHPPIKPGGISDKAKDLFDKAKQAAEVAKAQGGNQVVVGQHLEYNRMRYSNFPEDYKYRS